MQPLNDDSGSSEKVDTGAKTGAKIKMTRAELYTHFTSVKYVYNKYTHFVAKWEMSDYGERTEDLP